MFTCSPVNALQNEIQKGPANTIRALETLMTWLRVLGCNLLLAIWYGQSEHTSLEL